MSKKIGVCPYFKPEVKDKLIIRFGQALPIPHLERRGNIWHQLDSVNGF
jgi:hypothetical protein